MGFFIVLNYAFSKGAVVLVTFKDIQCIVEIKEAVYGMLFLVAGIYFYDKTKIKVHISEMQERIHLFYLHLLRAAGFAKKPPDSF